MSSARPRGRRPGSSDTRERILAAARERFAAQGYDRTRVRDVAADAGVDSALVHYFFGTKDGLFVAAMDLPFRPADVIGPLMAEGVDGLGERLVRALVGVWDEPAHQTRLLGLMFAQAEAPREFVRHEIVSRLAGLVGPLRANLVASQLVGLIMARYVVRLQPLASLPADKVVRLVAPTVQRYLDGAL